MKYNIVLAPESVEDLRGLDARVRAAVEDAMRHHLRHEPTKISRSRIKRLRGMSRPQYRLRVDDIRVFYDVNEGEMVVEVLAIIAKENAYEWLEEEGKREEGKRKEGGGSVGGQG